MSDELVVRHFDARGAEAQRDELTGLYRRVWLAGWKDDDPFFSTERFADRLDSHLTRPGFALVTARLDGHLIGYIYGFGRTAEDKFIICELMVAADHRRQGIATRLHDEVLSTRREQSAELLVDKQNAPAQSAYRRWGWRRTGDLQPFPDAPDYDVMGISLPIGTGRPWRPPRPL
ncbi:MAG TPA: GNAT family N-acetyltransferase [Rugosimonospora sp.]|nr:GNAT family N-acetyltransferase [Rugosimonospora sp.]